MHGGKGSNENSDASWPKNHRAVCNACWSEADTKVEKKELQKDDDDNDDDSDDDSDDDNDDDDSDDHVEEKRKYRRDDDDSGLGQLSILTINK